MSSAGVLVWERSVSSLALRRAWLLPPPSQPQWGSYAVASKLAGGAKSQVGSAMVSLGSVGKKKQTDASAA